MKGPSREMLRTQLFASSIGRLTGLVLELGVGRKIEGSRYGRDARVIAADVSLRRVRLARKGAGDGQPVCVYLLVADAARLPFQDSAFDGIVASFLMCSVDDVGDVSRELARVAKPGASLTMLEHIRSENSWLGAIQDAATPVYRRVCNNCHLNRTPRLSLEEHGFVISNAEVTAHFIPWIFLTALCRKDP